MANGIGRDRLFSRLQPTGEDIWSIIRELAQTSEPERRRLLRPHAEMLFSTDDQGVLDKERRRRLDVALGALTMLEIAYETEVATEEDGVPELDNLRQLCGSEAFLRYVNAYLYFGIRFLARRIMPGELPTIESVKKSPPRTSNKQLFSLQTPPSLSGYSAADNTFATLLDLSARCDPAINYRNLTPQVQALTLLDGFTNDSAENSEDVSSESERFELWLRGLSPESGDAEQARFLAISSGLREWAVERSSFYLSLQSRTADPALPATETAEQGGARPIGGWVVTNPLAARFALADIYWISRILRAEVQANASVTYSRSNWLHLLRFRAVLDGGADAIPVQHELQKAEQILCSVFDFVCDLVQNAVEITGEQEKQAYEPELFTDPSDVPNTTARWRKVFDDELNEIERQRDRRQFTHGASLNVPPFSPVPGPDDVWMERIRKNKPTRNLIGLSFSGGGIRSATFNLGVLQGLQEFDLLRKIDFLSTVSGGGFIGSWLLANVHRTRHWLGRLMNWEDSIDHLRRYSNYLAPRLGMFSTDTWSMWVSWARNSFLIQLTGLAWLWALFLSALALEVLFRWAARPDSVVVAASLMTVVLLTLLYNLSSDRAVSGKPTSFKNKWILRAANFGFVKRLVPGLPEWLRSGRSPSSGTSVWLLAIVPSWCASFLIASLLWGGDSETSKVPTFHDALEKINTSYVSSRWLMVGWSTFVLLALGLVAFITLSRLRDRGFVERIGWRIGHATWISIVCGAVLVVELWGILSLFGSWSSDRHRFVWYAFVLGPPLVLAAHTVSVVLFIGFCGKHSDEAVREWWTRFGAGLAMFGVAYLALTTDVVFGPCWILGLLGLGFVKWSSIITWIATVIGGLLAGKSSKTNGNETTNKSSWLQILAKVGGFAFIVGAVLAASTALYVVLALILAPAWNWHGHSATMHEISHAHPRIFIGFLVAAACGALFSRFFEINIFGLNQFYRFRLVRCYLGATRWAAGFRKPQPFTNFDGDDDSKLGQLFDEEFRGPFPIFNCALNLSGSSDLALHTRHSASFSLTSLWCGCDRRRVGYAPTSSFAQGVMLGQAVAISGAAASPNMGFNTSPLVAFLLTMFNVRLGWWFPNPGRNKWYRPGLSFSLYYLLLELFGVADEKSKFVNVSDGGHFENLGVYELIRRRCKVIIVCDAECDELLQFGSLGNLVRLCETDFGAKIDIDVSSIRRQKEGFSLTHCTVGHITYCNGSQGYMIYLKSSMSGDEDVGIAQYRSVHPSFPHETTADQFFSEDQFEAYRRLGLHVVRQSFRGSQPGDHPVAIAEKLADVLAPAGCASEAFLKHAKTLNQVWERFRQTPELHHFFEELMRQTISAAAGQQNLPLPEPSEQEKLIGLELIQIMEDVFLDLRLDDFWSHPDNRGWAILFMRWARSPRLRAIWQRTRRTFGIRFEYFCEARLGLQRDKPIVRV